MLPGSSRRYAYRRATASEPMSSPSAASSRKPKRPSPYAAGCGRLRQGFGLRAACILGLRGRPGERAGCRARRSGSRPRVALVALQVAGLELPSGPTCARRNRSTRCLRLPSERSGAFVGTMRGLGRRRRSVRPPLSPRRTVVRTWSPSVKRLVSWPISVDNDLRGLERM